MKGKSNNPNRFNVGKKSLSRRIEEMVNDFREHMLFEKPLSKIRQEQFKHVKAAWGMKCEGYTDAEIVAMMESAHDLSHQAVYNYLYAAMRLFGDLPKYTKEGMRWLVFEQNMRVFRLAEERGNLEVMERCLRNNIKLFRIDSDDPDIPNFDKLEQNVYVTYLPPAAQQAMQAMLKRGVIDGRQFEEAFVEEIDQHGQKEE